MVTTKMKLVHDINGPPFVFCVKRNPTLQVMIGSSMGAWMSLLAAMERPERVKGLMLIAPAVDFFTKHLRSYPLETQERIERGEAVKINGLFGPFLFSKRIIDESREHEILSRPGKLAIRCPVRIFHGMKDDRTPYQVGLELCDKFESENVEILLRKTGEHRLSTRHDIQLLCNCLDSLLEVCE